MARRRKPTDPVAQEEQRERDKAKEFSQWEQRVARARRIRETHLTRFQVETGEQFYLGQQGQGKDKLKFNRFAATLKTRRANLFYSNPKFYVRPKPGRVEPTAERRAAIGEGVLEAIAQQDDHLERNGRLSVNQSFFLLGVLKTCYDPRMEPNPKAGEPIMATIGGEPMRDDLGEPVPMRDPMTMEILREPAKVLTDEVYRWRWVDAHNMLLPDEGPDRDAWTWIGEEVIVPLEDAKQDERFRGKTITANAAGHDPRREQAGSRPDGEQDEEMFRYVEVYDLRRKRLLIWADGENEPGFLVNEPVPAWIEDHPYALLPLGEPVLGPEPSPWPVPVVYDWIDVQSEYNTRREQITQGAKRSARKVAWFDGSFADETTAEQWLNSPKDMEGVKVTDPRLIPQVIGDRDLPNTVYADIPLLDQDWKFVTGMPGSRLATPDSDTATEATFVERAANIRESDAQRAVALFMAEAGRKMLQCVKATLTLDLWIALKEMGDKEFMAYAERVFQIPREQIEMFAQMFPGVKEAFRQRIAAQKWVNITRQDLMFEADVTVVPGSMRPKNLDVERNSWMEFLRVIGGAPQLLMSRELLRYTAERFDVQDDRLLDELHALGQSMIAVNANQAGRNQGGAAGQPGRANGQPITQALMGAS